MWRLLDRRLVLLLAAVALGPGGAVAATSTSGSAPAVSASASAPAPAVGDMSLGSAKAKVTVVEYASMSCPHCARFNNNVFPAFRKKYVDSGKVRYVLREYLTQPVEVAEAGFMLARCAGKGGYFSVIDTFFHGQEEMYRVGDAGPLIGSAGAVGGLTAPQIEACLSDDAARKALEARVEGYATHEGVDSTPTFVINGQKLPELDHEVQLADLDKALAPLLSKPRGH